jgi:DHA1 family bicyclomycin/chloramphenicol resistance-like MFS transporter
MAGNFISGRIGVRVGSDRMIMIGTVLSMVGGLVMLVVTLAGSLDLVAFFLISGVMSVGNGFSMPNGFAGAVSVDPSRAGTASGLAGALQMGIGAILMTVVGHTLSDSALPVVVMMLVGAVLAWLSHLHGLRR